jgi:hypothetical protein
MKTVGILLIGLGTGFIAWLSKTSPDTSTDSSLMLIIAGIIFLTFGLFADSMTSQHSDTQTKRSR